MLNSRKEIINECDRKKVSQKINCLRVSPRVISYPIQNSQDINLPKLLEILLVTVMII